MKHITTWLTITLFILSGMTFGQAPGILWDKDFGGSNWEEVRFTKQTSDGGYVSGGLSYSPISGSKSQPNWDPSLGSPDYWIVKTDINGMLQWEKRFGGSGWDQFNSMQQTSDGGYILGGYSSSPISGNKSQAPKGLIDYWVVKLDATGVLQWDKTFGGSSNDYLTVVIQTNDGGYMLSGFSQSGISGDHSESNRGALDFWMVKTDALGNKLWDKRFGGPQDDWAYSIAQTADNGYLIAGTSASGAGGDKSEPNRGPLNTMDYWVVKTDVNGAKLWDKRFGTSDDDLCSVALQTTDNDFILGGYSSGGISGDRSVNSRGWYDYWIVKIDATGLKIWDKRYGGTEIDYLFSMELTPDNGFILGGTSYSNISGDKSQVCRGNEDYWIIKLNSAGGVEWDKTMGGTGSDWLNYVSPTTGGGYILGGNSDSPVSGEKTQPVFGINDYWVIKLGPDEPLPISLISFEAKTESDAIAITWMTACEINNDYFVLEKSTNGKFFEPITIVNGQGTSCFPKKYYYTDHAPNPGLNYYRLVQYDYDGNFSESEIIYCRFSETNFTALSVFPNPAYNSIQLNKQIEEEIRIVDATGKKVLVIPYCNSCQIDITGLENGTYFLQTETGIGTAFSVQKP